MPVWIAFALATAAAYLAHISGFDNPNHQVAAALGVYTLTLIFAT